MIGFAKKHPSAFSGILLLILTFLAHGIALFNPYYFDDYLVLKNNAWLTGSPHPNLWFFDFYFDRGQIFDGWRPILMNSFLLNAIVLEPAAWAYRLGNLLLHALNAFLLFRISRRLLKNGHQSWIPLLSALIFALHPLQTLGINFLWKRSTILMATFLLSSLLIHLKARNKEIRWGMAVPVQLLLFFLAVGTKESGIIMPLLLVFVDLLQGRSMSTFRERKTWALYLPLFAMALGYFYFRTEVIVETIIARADFLHDFRSLSRWEYLWTSFTVFPKYALLLLFPQPRIFDDPTPQTEFPTGAFAWTLSLLILSVWAAYRWRKSGWVPLGILLIWIPLLPSTSIFPIRFSMDQIRLYLPVAGFAMLLSGILVALRSRVRLRLGFLLILFPLLYGFLSLAQNQRYKDPIDIWSDVVDSHPKSEAAYGELARHFRERKMHKESAAAFFKAAQLAPDAPIFLVNSWMDLQNLGVDLSRDRERVLSIDTDKLPTMGQIDYAVVLSNLGEDDRAIEILLNLIGARPMIPDAHFFLGLIFSKVDRTKDARRAFQNTLKLDPDHKAARRLSEELSP